jgi:hypothetical protein
VFELQVSLSSGYRDSCSIIINYLVVNVIKIYLKPIYVFQAYKKESFGLDNVKYNAANLSLDYNSSAKLFYKTITKHNVDLATTVLI